MGGDENLLALMPQPPEFAWNWQAIEGIHPLKDLLTRMSRTPQDPAWHGEGDVLTHTRMVCEALSRLDGFRSMEAGPRDALALAALLHDTLEDTDTTAGQILERFGERVAALVGAESEDKRDDRPRGETWRIRKEESLETLKAAPREAKLVALGDKLSNMREMARDYAKMGDGLWEIFHQKDKAQHEWYYRSMHAILAEEFPDAPAVQELGSLIEGIFD